ncbi:MAG TPA: DUF2917 domain-containing protein [Ramlibacter sp.]
MPTEPALIVLAPRQLHTIADASGVEIACRSGAVWITVDGDLNDYVLEAGDTFVTDKRARVLVYALGAARIDLAQLQSRKDTMVMLSRFHPIPLTNAAR